MGHESSVLMLSLKGNLLKSTEEHMDFGISLTQMGADGDWFREFALCVWMCVCVFTGLCMPASSHMSFIDGRGFWTGMFFCFSVVHFFPLSHYQIPLISHTLVCTTILQLWSCLYHNSPSLPLVWNRFGSQFDSTYIQVCWLLNFLLFLISQLTDSELICSQFLSVRTNVWRPEKNLIMELSGSVNVLIARAFYLLFLFTL